MLYYIQTLTFGFWFCRPHPERASRKCPSQLQPKEARTPNKDRRNGPKKHRKPNKRNRKKLLSEKWLFVRLFFMQIYPYFSVQAHDQHKSLWGFVLMCHSCIWLISRFINNKQTLFTMCVWLVDMIVYRISFSSRYVSTLFVITWYTHNTCVGLPAVWRLSSGLCWTSCCSSACLTAAC